jgi:hypothetical protein
MTHPSTLAARGQRTLRKPADWPGADVSGLDGAPQDHL